MFETLCASLETQRAIFGAAVLGDFLLAVLVCLLMELRKARGNAQTRNALTGSPPDETETDEEKRRKAKEEAEAWAELGHYSVRDAYGGGESG